MKQIFYSIMAAGLILTGVSCQKVDEKCVDINAGGLIVTADIVDNDATKVSYSFEEDNPKNALKAIWEKEDQIFGFDDQGNKFTYEVNEVDDNGKAEFKLVGQYEPGEATTLYAVYYPGKYVNNIVDNEGVKSIAVDLSKDNGILNGGAPVIMLATGTIENGAVHFNFLNQTAIVGIYKFQLPDVSTSTKVTEISLNGVRTKGTIKISSGSFKLVNNSTGSTGTISISDLNLMSDANGIVEVNPKGDIAPYFAVIPGSYSRIISVNAKTENGFTYGVGEIVNEDNSDEPMSLTAGKYYYLGKKLAQPATLDDNPCSLKAAFENATAGSTIKLTANCTADGILDLANASNSTESNPVVFDLNGHELKVGQYKRIELTQGYLKIDDSSDKRTGKIVCPVSTDDAIIVKKGSSLKFANGEVQGGDYAICNNGGTLIIENGTFSGGSLDAVIRTERLEGETQKVTTTIKNGTFTNSSSKYVFSCDRTVTLTIEDGTFTTGGPTVVYDNNSNVTVNISGGTFNNNGTDNKILDLGIKDERNWKSVSGGKFKGKFDEKFLAANCNFSSNKIGDYWTVQVNADNAPVAIGDKYYPSVDDAFAAAKGGETIKLLKECTPTSNLALSTNAGSSKTNPVTLDLNGQVLNSSLSTRIELTDGMHMKIINSLTGTPGEIKGSSENTDVLSMDSGSSLVVCGGKIYNGAYAIFNNGGTLTINDGYFSGGHEKGVIRTIKGGATTTIHGGEFVATANNAVLTCDNKVTLTIEDGTFTTGGPTVVYDDNSYVTVNISGGTFNNNGTDNKILDLGIKDERNWKSVSGGKFKGKFNEEFLASGYKFSDSQDADDYWSVQKEPVMQVNGVDKYSVSDALNEANGSITNVTIKVLKDILLNPNEGNTKPDTLLFNNTNSGVEMTLDLNGKTISCPNDNRYASRSVLALRSGTLTIIDNSDEKTGQIVHNLSSGTSNDYGVVTVYGGVLNVKGGKITCEHSGYGKSGIRLRYWNKSLGAQTVNIYDGATVVGKTAITLQSGNPEYYATLNVYGGLLEGTYSTSGTVEKKASAIRFNDSRGDVNIYGGIIKANSAPAIYWAYKGIAIKISNGKMFSNNQYVIGQSSATLEEINVQGLNFYSNKNDALNVTKPTITGSGLDTYIYKWGIPQEQPAN